MYASVCFFLLFLNKLSMVMSFFSNKFLIIYVLIFSRVSAFFLSSLHFDFAGVQRVFWSFQIWDGSKNREGGDVSQCQRASPREVGLPI